MILLALTLALAEDCASCHADVAYVHARSRHGRAFTNPSFQAAWTRHPDPWCLTCHAREGVSCEDCHGEVAAVVGPVDAPHPTRVVPDLRTSSCQGCHGFAPPGASVLLQTTAAEHVPAAGACADCHGAHRARGARDQDFVREALAVDVQWDEGWSARVQARGAGHAVPTGDPFRQLLLEVGAGEAVLDRVRFGRAVEGVGEGFREVSDSRLPPPGPDGVSARTVRLEAPEATWWRLRFQLVDPSHAELQGDEAGWVVREGELSR